MTFKFAFRQLISILLTDIVGIIRGRPNKASLGPACVFCITWGISGEAVSKKHPETIAGIQSLILKNRIFQELPKGLVPHLRAPTWLLSWQEVGTAWWR